MTMLDNQHEPSNMKRFTLIAICLAAFPATGEEAAKHSIFMYRHSLQAAMAYYEHLTGKKVQIADGVSANVTVVENGPIARAAVVALIERQLLERHGIALRTTPKGEVIAEWSNDPKYPHSVEPRIREGDAKATPPPRIRVLGH